VSEHGDAVLGKIDLKLVAVVGFVHALSSVRENNDLGLTEIVVLKITTEI
jgi:hypothetical protein